MTPQEAWPRRERLLVVLVALHSYAVGICLLSAPEWGAQLGGWPPLGTPFFARQAGAFHLVVATGYLLEHLRYGRIGLLLLAKSTAVAFLGMITLLGDAPWAVPLSAAADLSMGLAAWWVHRRAAAVS